MNSPEPDKNSTMAVNLIMQFLFHELRYATGVRKWVHRKLSLELDELIAKTTIGRFFDKLTVYLLSSIYTFKYYIYCVDIYRFVNLILVMNFLKLNL